MFLKKIKRKHFAEIIMEAFEKYCQLKCDCNCNFIAYEQQIIFKEYEGITEKWKVKSQN